MKPLARSGSIDLKLAYPSGRKKLSFKVEGKHLRYWEQCVPKRLGRLEVPDDISAR